jgi:hypothetical protein
MSAPTVSDQPKRWPIFLIAAPAAVAVWSGWVGLGTMAGFGIVHPLPGIISGFHLNTAITLPIGVEAYGAYALGTWLHSAGVPARARKFAQRSAIGALILGMLGQVIYHLLAAAHRTRAPWPVVVLVACLPVAVLGLAATLAHLRHAGDATPEATKEPEPSATEEPSAEATKEPPERAITEPSREAIGESHQKAIEGPSGEATGEPEQVPPKPERREPRAISARPAKDPEAERAHRAYRKSVREGAPLSDRALGAMFGRSRTWGASRISEVDGGPQLAEAAGE